MGIATAVKHAISQTAPAYCQIESDYLRRDRNYANEAIKQPQRERVLDFLIRHRKAGNKPVLLSNPGLHWTFERMMIEALPNTRLVGVELNWGILEYAARFMPRTYRQLVKTDWTTDVGVVYGFNGILNKKFSHRSICAPIEQLAAMKKSRQKFSDGKDRSWRHAFFSNTMIWVDTFCPLGRTSKISLLQNIRHLCSRKCEQVPFVLTFMLGRDDSQFVSAIDRLFPDESPLDRRALMAKQIIDAQGGWRFEIKETWFYGSNHEHSCAMGNIAGILHKVV